MFSTSPPRRSGDRRVANNFDDTLFDSGGDAFAFDATFTSAASPAATLMRLDQVRSNPLFAGVDGHGETVVVIDSGADLDHSAFGPDANADGIADRIVFQANFVGAGGGSANDGNGHGTHVAGIIGSQDASYLGMAPGCNIIVLRVLNNSGSGTSADIEEAFQWIVANHALFPNIVSVNISIGDHQNLNTSTPGHFLVDEVAQLTSYGIATVVAGGNDYAFYGTPGVNGLAACPGVWGVASTLNNADVFSSFSQRSSTMTELAAPGSNITSSYLNNGTATLSGTSMAAPAVAGLVALAQDLSEEISGSRLSTGTLLDLMRTSGFYVTDGVSAVPRIDGLSTMYNVMAYWQRSTAGADNIYGWRGDDVLSAGAGNDMIRGNVGNDTIDGGAGVDTAVFAGLRSQYTVTGYASGTVHVLGPDGNDSLMHMEKVAFADQTLWPDDYGADAGTGGSLAANTSLSGTLETLGDHDWYRIQLRGGIDYTIALQGASGNLSALNDSYLRLRDSGSTVVAQNDNFGGTSDAQLTFRPAASGVYYIDAGAALDNGVGSYQLTVSATLNQVPANDFNNDFMTDILWRTADGHTAVWQMSGTTVQSSTDLGMLDPSWHVAPGADFDGDGKSDILWRHDSGLTAVWEMNGGQIKTPASLGVIGPSWQVQLGDFDGDHKSDLLWRDSQGGQTVLWEMNGTSIKSGFDLGMIGTTWNLDAVADFDGDGKADIVWREQGGYTAMWEMDGGHIKAGMDLGIIGPGWQLAGTGDFDGDGKADIVWRDASGLTCVWLMDGGHIKTGAVLGVLDPTWQIAMIGDFNADGMSDMVWRHQSGQAAIWQMNGTHIMAAADLGMVGSAWHIANHDLLV